MSLCNLFDKPLSYVSSYFQNLNFLKTINIFRVDENCVWLDLSGRTRLYCIKLEGRSNREKNFDNFEHLVKKIKYSPDGEIFVSYVSKELHKAVYIFAYSESALLEISAYFSSKILDGEKIVDVLYDIFLITDYRITEDNRQVPSEMTGGKFVPSNIETVSGKFKAKVQLALAKNTKESTMYQAVSFINKTPFSMIEFFKREWEGVFTIKFDFRTNAVKNRLVQYKNIAKFADKDFGKVCDYLIDNKDKELSSALTNSVCIANAVLFLSNKSKEKLSYISNDLGIEFMENYLNGESILARTIFLQRDMDFDTLIKTDVAKKFFKTSLKKQVSPSNMAYFNGKDACGNFVNYNYLEAASTPHTICLGRNGSGKSVQIIKTIEQMIGLNKERTFASRLGEIKIRYSDVGFTSGRLLETMLSCHREQTLSIKADIAKLRFSLFDLTKENGEIPEEEINYLVGIINFAIQTKGKNSSGLDGNEEKFFKDVVKDMILNDVYYNYPVSILSQKAGYDNLYNEILKEGHNKDTQFSELPNKYSFLRKPVIQDVINRINTEKNKSEFTDVQKKIMENLSLKLQSLSSYEFLQFHSNMPNEEDLDFIHIDFDSMKDDPASFTVVYWMLMKRWIKMLKTSAKERFSVSEAPIDTFFVIEESHNFFAYPAFEKMLITASKELRKYGGKLIFVTQQLDDIPEKVSKEIGTKIFVSSPDNKAMLKEDIRKVFKKLEKKDEEVLDYTDVHTMYIMYDGGSISCKYEFTEEDLWYYKPYEPQQ